MAKRKPVAELYRAHSWSLATDTAKPTVRQPHMFYRAQDIDELVDLQNQMIAHLTADVTALRSAGLALVSRSAYAIGEYDGHHRMALAAAEFLRVVADEGGRGERHKGED